MTDVQRGLKLALFIVYMHTAIPIYAQLEQENSSAAEALLEHIAEKYEEDNEDESYIEQLRWFTKHPLNINQVTPEELAALMPLSALHLDQFFKYRNLLGRFISIYELQAIPLWNVELIQSIVPYIIIEDDKNIVDHIRNRLNDGEHTMLIRTSRVPEKAKGYRIKGDSVSHYQGSPQKVYMRYKYSYRNLLQVGILAEKDAGEQFFKDKQRYGFDFYSAHFFLRKAGIIKSMALGDFTVNMGQGLVHWQGMGSGKGSDVLNIKRQSPILKPYHSAGEFNFMRGAGITLYKGRWEGTGFISNRRLDASFSTDAGTNVITSINTSGYHRTFNEATKKGNTALFSAGGSLKYTGQLWNAGLNAIQYRYSDNILKRNDAYNLYAIKGNKFTNIGVDYNYTIRNMHLFGEMAFDKNMQTGFINGLLISLDKKVDVSVVHRALSPSYQTIYGNAFTENTYPVNENGMYLGMHAKLGYGLSVAAYADIFTFPWLKYRVDARSFGKDYMVQLAYKPDKKTELYIKYRTKNKGLNEVGESNPLPYVQTVRGQNLRIHASTEPFSAIIIRSRCEVNWHKTTSGNAEQGFLWMTDLLYKPLSGSWTGNLRIAFFNTDSYNSRIYAYENDVLYASSITPLYARGFRSYFNLRKKILVFEGKFKRSLNIYLRWSRNNYTRRGIGSGIDEIEGFKRSEYKLQLILL